jgi:hypothetical protein
VQLAKRHADRYGVGHYALSVKRFLRSHHPPASLTQPCQPLPPIPPHSTYGQALADLISLEMIYRDCQTRHQALIDWLIATAPE